MLKDHHEPTVPVTFWFVSVGSLAVSKDNVFVSSRERAALIGKKIVVLCKLVAGDASEVGLVGHALAALIDGCDDDQENLANLGYKFCEAFFPRLAHRVAGSNKVVDEHECVIRTELLQKDLARVYKKFVVFLIIEAIGDVEPMHHRIAALSAALSVSEEHFRRLALRLPPLFLIEPETLLQRVRVMSDVLQLPPESTAMVIQRRAELLYARPDSLRQKLQELADMSA